MKKKKYIVEGEGGPHKTKSAIYTKKKKNFGVRKSRLEQGRKGRKTRKTVMKHIDLKKKTLSWGQGGSLKRKKNRKGNMRKNIFGKSGKKSLARRKIKERSDREGGGRRKGMKKKN